MSLKFCIVLVLLGPGAASLDAQMMTVKDYRDMKDTLNRGKDDPTLPQATMTFDLYVKGIGDGFVWANALLESTHRERLFCVPEKLDLDSRNYQQILESFLPTLNSKVHWPLRTWKSVEEVPVGFVLIEALVDAFPCGAAPKQ